MDLIWNRDETLKLLFDTPIGGVRKYQVEGFWLSCIAAGFLSAEVRGKELTWVLNKDDLQSLKPSFEDAEKWDGFHFLDCVPGYKFKYKQET